VSGLRSSIDTDPAPFNTMPHRMILRSYGGPTTVDRDDAGVVEYFKYVHATAMMRKPEAHGRQLPAHVAYKPHTRSRTSTLGGGASEGNGSSVGVYLEHD
jgi:hypothetical protein